MSNLNVLVVGASIAGPTAAYWLSRAGAKVTVIERFPSLRTNGQNVDIRASAVTVMRRMPGMEAAVRNKVPPLEGISFVRADGRSYGTIRATGDPDQQSLVSEYEIFRGDLSQIVFDLTKDDENIRYVFGEQVSALHQSDLIDGPVTVDFANGVLPTSKYDLVIACDGATSRTRGLGLNCGIRDHVHPTNCWAAFFTMKGDLFQDSKVGHAFSAPGGRFFAVGSAPTGGATNVVLMAINPQDARDTTLPLREATKAGGDELKQFVASHFKDAGWKTPEILRGMAEAEDFYANEVVTIRLPSLSKGRFALVGDAGYAPGFTGAGTTLAMTGAYVLAGEIAKHKGDLAAGLAGYEKTMRPIIDKLQKTPPFLPGLLSPQTAWAITLRNNVFGFIAWTRLLEIFQRFFAGAFANTSEYPLPDYQWEK